MSSHPGAFDLPQRLSLSAQTATAIRKAIEANAWQDFLPSERRLCDMFQVSRPTVRTALQQLAKEGLIEIHQGRRNRLLATARTAAPRSRLVVLVSHQPMSQMTLTSYQGISEMRTHLAEHGFATEVFVCPAQSAKVQQRKLDVFLRQNRVFCCVLLSLSKELQEWFAAHAIPSLVLGSCHPAVKLPSLDVDYRSVCRHAAGLLRGQGHQRIAFIVPNSNVAGDLASEEGFLGGCTPRRPDDGSEALIVRHSGTPVNIAAKLDALFASARPPTALLVAKPQHVFFVVVYLLRRGIKVPQNLSLIARDHDHLFEDAISHYRFEGETFAHRLSRLMLQMVNHDYLPPEPNLIFPHYVSAGTVKQRLG
jgi:DNA-binding LacI/PurR family transcriptional regulator